MNIQKIVNRELRKVRKWLEANRLAINIEKTNFVIFRSQQRIITDRITLKNWKKEDQARVMCPFFGCAVRFYPELEEPLDRTI